MTIALLLVALGLVGVVVGVALVRERWTASVVGIVVVVAFVPLLTAFALLA